MEFARELSTVAVRDAGKRKKQRPSVARPEGPGNESNRQGDPSVQGGARAINAPWQQGSIPATNLGRRKDAEHQ